MTASIEYRAPATAGRAPRWLLVGGLGLGAALAAAGLRSSPIDDALPPQAVARVNGHLILRDAWLRAVAAVASARRTPLSDDDERHILDRLVDEELLVQHGLALGLAESDARLRSTMVSEVMVAASDASTPALDDAALRRFYDAHRDFFTPAGRLRVRAWQLDAAGQRRPFEPEVPDALLPVAKLQAYLGPALTARALSLSTGETSEPIDSEGGPVVLTVLESQPVQAPPFEQVRDEVRVEAKRRADEAAVAALLSRLRKDNDVVVDTATR